MLRQIAKANRITLATIPRTKIKISKHPYISPHYTLDRFYLLIYNLNKKGEQNKMFNIILSQSTSAPGTSTMFIIIYILIIGLVFLAIPIGIIFLIYFLIKKLIKYYKTGE